jgi:DNA ligase-1
MVVVSSDVAGTRSRLEKTARLAAFVGGLRGREIQIGVAYLSGMLPQGRIGLGWSAMAAARAAGTSADPRLELVEVDATFEKIAQTKGTGAARTRQQLLSSLFAHATGTEQEFLIRLISGELRQGALEGLLTEAIAKASGAPADAVRQASMMWGISAKWPRRHSLAARLHSQATPCNCSGP